MANTIFGGYKNEGKLVDRKGYNLHISGLCEDATHMTAAGALGFGTLNATGEIPAGAIVIDSGTSGIGGANAGYINISKGLAGELLLGVAVEAREAADVRPIAITWCGYVRLMAGTGGVTKGDLLTPDTVANYYGCAITWADAVDTIANSLAKKKVCFGKALTSAGVGEYFDAYVNFAGV
jgi:hypothetical protein